MLTGQSWRRLTRKQNVGVIEHAMNDAGVYLRAHNSYADENAAKQTLDALTGLK